MIRDISTNSHEEWLGLRSNYIGGSDAGAVIGTNPYKSAYTLWAEKTGKIPPFEGNLTTKVGSYLEDLVASLFSEETGKKVRRKNATMVNDLYPFSCANVDRVVVGENSFLEIKTTNSIPIMKALNASDEFPDAYYAQCVHYMAVGGYEKCYLAVLINCRELKIYSMDRDQGEIDALMNAEEEFWQYVKTGKQPPVDGTESTSDTLSSLYPGSDGSQVDLTPIEIYLNQYKDAVSAEKSAKALKDEAANQVKSYLGNASGGSCGKFKVSYNSSDRKSFDVKSFEKENPTVATEAYYKVSTYRTLRITESK